MEPKSFHPKLTPILSTDVAGYSRHARRRGGHRHSLGAFSSLPANVPYGHDLIWVHTGGRNTIIPKVNRSPPQKRAGFYPCVKRRAT